MWHWRESTVGFGLLLTPVIGEVFSFVLGVDSQIGSMSMVGGLIISMGFGLIIHSERKAEENDSALSCFLIF